ncbi:MAG: amidase [Solirubrobacteraceae bacterium]
MAEATISELLFRPATELAEMVRRGEVSARELVDASLEQIERLDPQINAFVHVDADAAREAADAIGPGDERPFAGVPLAIKDIGPPWEGRPLTFGAELFGDFVPDFDGSVVRRLKEAGFVPVGKTNAPEFGILPVTEPRRYGPTRNPWDTDRTPGGSSGGSGAATAAGMVPIAHGNDGGGSIRIPAACCGLVGLKPSRGRISHAPVLGESYLATDGVLSRTVEDTARALDVLAGYELGDVHWAPPPPEPFAQALQRDPERAHIGFTEVPPLDAPVDPTYIEAVEETVRLLESLGHRVERFDPPWTDRDLFQTFTTMWAVAIGMTALFASQVSGREPTQESMEPLSWELYRRGRDTSAYEHGQAMVALQNYARTMVAQLSRFDAFLTPALGQRPVRIGEIDPETGMDAFARAGRFTPFTAVVNVSGQPAISLPLYQGDDGLPTAVHLIGRPAGEWELLALSAQLERARPWADRRPPIS